MSLWKVAWRSIQQRALASGLTALSMGLAVALVVAVLVIHSVVDKSFKRGSQGYDLIVGAKGGKLELVLNTVFYLGEPVENIPYQYYQEKFVEGEFVTATEAAIPICMGHSYKGCPVVATIHEMFAEKEYLGEHVYDFKEGGANFDYGDHYGAVIGSEAARKTDLKLGDTFKPMAENPDGSAAHEDEPFTVRGILEYTGTPNDGAIFVNMEGFFLCPSHQKQASSVKRFLQGGDRPEETTPKETPEEMPKETPADNGKTSDPTASDESGDTQKTGDDHAHDDVHEPDIHDDQQVPTDAADESEDTAEKNPKGDAPSADEHEAPEPAGGEPAVEEPAAEHSAEDHAAENGEDAHGEDAHDEHAHDEHAHGEHAHGEDAHGEDAHGEDAHDEHAHDAHDHDSHREITAILVRTNMEYPQLAMTLAAVINEGPDAQAVRPARVIARLFDSIVGNVQLMLLMIAVLVVIVAGIGIMVSIYNSMSDRRYEIAVMRALGARRWMIMVVILMESILLSLGGGLFGVLLGHTLIGALSPTIYEETGVIVSAFEFQWVELILVPGLIALATIVGYLPAVAAYQTDVAKSLSAAQ